MRLHFLHTPRAGTGYECFERVGCTRKLLGNRGGPDWGGVWPDEVARERRKECRVMKTGTAKEKFYETEADNDEREGEKKRISQKQECRGVTVEYT